MYFELEITPIKIYIRYYDLNQLRADFGKITKYEAPKVFYSIFL
jgi:hypothetical protein